MRHSTLPAVSLSTRKPLDRAAHGSRSDVRDFLLLSLFVSAFMAACYLALWKPFLAQWIP